MDSVRSPLALLYWPFLLYLQYRSFYHELYFHHNEILDGTRQFLPIFQRSSRVTFHPSRGEQPESPATDALCSYFSQVVSSGTILINICEYGIPFTNKWLIYTMECLFWIYTGISMIASAGMYLILWSTQ